MPPKKTEPVKEYERPCPDFLILQDSFKTLRVIMYGSLIVALSVLGYLYINDDNLDKSINSQAVAIGEINQSIVFIRESQRRAEDLLLRQLGAPAYTDSLKLSSSIADIVLLPEEPVASPACTPAATIK